MKQISENGTDIDYINSNELLATAEFTTCLYKHLFHLSPLHRHIILLCIGTDRATGDCLGPIIGYKLQHFAHKNFSVLGTLDQPIHAVNLSETIKKIYDTYSNPLIIAIDACLGKYSHIGYITIAKGVIHPGAGLNKNLPAVGDIAITGIVNLNGIMSISVLQNTRLNVVMKMADIISSGIRQALFRYEKYCLEQIFQT